MVQLERKREPRESGSLSGRVQRMRATASTVLCTLPVAQDKSVLVPAGSAEESSSILAETGSPAQCDRRATICPTCSLPTTRAPGWDPHVRLLCKAECATFKETTKELLIFEGKAHDLQRHKEDIKAGSRRRGSRSASHYPSWKQSTD